MLLEIELEAKAGLTHISLMSCRRIVSRYHFYRMGCGGLCCWLVLGVDKWCHCT